MTTELIKYKGETILFTAGLYFWRGLQFSALDKAKKAINNAIRNKQKGLY